MPVIPFPLAVFGVLLGLTQADVISLPWWVIAAPLWGSAAIAAFIALVLLVFYGTFLRD